MSLMTVCLRTTGRFEARGGARGLTEGVGEVGVGEVGVGEMGVGEVGVGEVGVGEVGVG